jgi:hypothetical protein
MKCSSLETRAKVVSLKLYILSLDTILYMLNPRVETALRFFSVAREAVGDE